MTIREATATVLTNAKDASGMSLTQIGDKAGMSAQVAGKYTQGKVHPTVDMLVRLCEAMGKDPTEAMMEIMELRGGKAMTGYYEMTLYKYESRQEPGSPSVGWLLRDITDWDSFVWAYPVSVLIPNDFYIDENSMGEQMFFRTGETYAYDLVDNDYHTAPVLVGNGERVHLKLSDTGKADQRKRSDDFDATIDRIM